MTREIVWKVRFQFRKKKTPLIFFLSIQKISLMVQQPMGQKIFSTLPDFGQNVYGESCFCKEF